jgi:hypothetical protein
MRYLTHMKESQSFHVTIFSPLRPLYSARPQVTNGRNCVNGSPSNEPRSVRVRFAIDKVASGWDFIPALRLPHVSLITLLFRTN